MRNKQSFMFVAPFITNLFLLLDPTYGAEIHQAVQPRKKTVQVAERQKRKIHKSLEEALREPEKVYHLDLRGKGLKEFPCEIYKLTNLRFLGLRRNSLTKLPSDIGRLKNLQGLDVSYNQIPELPPEIGSLRQLRQLFLSGNKLKELPEDISQLGRARR